MLIMWKTLRAKAWKQSHLCCCNLSQKLYCEDPKEKSFQYGNRAGHVYHKANNISNISVSDLSKLLLNNVIYNKDGIVALNKPFGLGSSRSGLSCYDCLPSLAQNLGYENLNIVSIPDRFTSGITILAADKNKEAAVDRSLQKSKGSTPTSSKIYWAITVGTPTVKENVDKFAVTRQRKGSNNYEMILRKWTINSRKRREVSVGLIGHTLIDQSEHVSLVSIGTWVYHYHAPRAFLSDALLSPALGDHRFGPRVGMLFGKTIFIKPWHAPLSKMLPQKLLHSLHLINGEESFVPLHLHLHEIRLRKILRKSRDLILQAEPPEHFQWSCQQLQLNLPPTEPWKEVESVVHLQEKNNVHEE